MRWINEERLPAACGAVFVVLAVVGNALQGSTPALHGEAKSVAAFYDANPTRIAVGMSLSLVSLFFLAWFLGGLQRSLRLAEGGDGWRSRVGSSGGSAAIALLAAGFALNAAGALRAKSQGSIPPGSAVVFYDGGLALSGLAATLALAVLLAATALICLRFAAFPSWFGWLSAVLALVGVVTPVSFVLMLVFPVWVLVASVLLHRRPSTVTA